MNKTNEAPICYGQTFFRGFVQEFYETASKHAGIRARNLRKAGFNVRTAPLGYQVTSVGAVKMTLLNAYGEIDIDNLPAVRVERL
jgi:hypothetical protein